jgi:hypothetical protein
MPPPRQRFNPVSRKVDHTFAELEQAVDDLVKEWKEARAKLSFEPEEWRKSLFDFVTEKQWEEQSLPIRAQVFRTIRGNRDPDPLSYHFVSPSTRRRYGSTEKTARRDRQLSLERLVGTGGARMRGIELANSTWLHLTIVSQSSPMYP